MNIIEVTEFDIITCNENYKNDGKYIYLEEKVFKELEEFIYKFNASEENTEEILHFMKIEYRRNIGNVIRIKNYVGLIELKSGFKIQILPKISLGEKSEDNVETKKVFIEMLKCMKEFSSKAFTFANLNLDKMNLYEIFINMYIQEVRNLVKKGIKSSYIEKEENISFFKGKLQVNEQIKLNVCHKERFYMKFDEYQVNCPENKIIKSTLLKLQKISESAENIKQIKQLLVFFELVEPSENYKGDFSKIVIDRSIKYYENVIKWSKIFLLNSSFTTFSGDNFSRALLFPMERVFEAYLAKYVKRVFKDFEVLFQNKEHYLFDSPQRFALKPDLVVKCKSGKSIVMDTKWKCLFDSERANFGISQADMYQMYAYAKKYSASDVFLLYPVNDEMRGHERIRFVCEDCDERVCVNVFFVELGKDRVENSLGELLKLI